MKFKFVASLFAALAFFASASAFAEIEETEWAAPVKCTGKFCPT